jgi:cytosine/adenosine deaminase-related metal-dependent hydrolase
MSSAATPLPQPPARLIRARTVLPVIGPPIEDGAVLIANGRIVALDHRKTLRPPPGTASEDLGDCVLLPGLINAHCHLDYTNMAGQVSPPPSFSDWIKALLALKAHWTYSDYSFSWLQGARMLLRHGTTTVADIEAVPELLPEVLAATPLRLCTLLEMTGVRGRRTAMSILQEAADRIESLPAHLKWAGLSPHAPYSTTPELLRLSGQIAQKHGWLLATHVAESNEEFEMFMHRSGPMFDWLKSQRDVTDCGVGSPIHHLAGQGLLGRNLLAVHVNYLADGDAQQLAETGTTVVHCPRSHAYFKHQPFPRARLAKAGVRVCLGTDSLASVLPNPGTEIALDLFAEMRQLIKNEPSLSPESIVQMATVEGAAALGKAGLLGQLSAGALADLIALPFAGRTKEIHEAVLHHFGPVSRVMIGGNWIPQPSP